GGNVTFSCRSVTKEDVIQVTWQKETDGAEDNIATYTNSWLLSHGLRLIGSFQKKVHFTRPTPKATAITLQNLTLEDESYYKCVFSVFCHGSISKEMCLNIQ
ncbi:NECT1 protein, partial [Erpornis zantholeuca]|nr:NECT1 protein [Erpornis zantholeuca]